MGVLTVGVHGPDEATDLLYSGSLPQRDHHAAELVCRDHAVSILVEHLECVIQL